MKFALLIAAQFTIMDELMNTASARDDQTLTADEKNKYDTAEKELNRLQVLKDQSDKHEKLKAAMPVEDPANAAISKAHQIDGTTEMSTKKPYNDLGGFLQDVANSKNSDREATDRLVNAQLNTEAGADGGFLVKEEFVGDMMKKAEEKSQIWAKGRNMQMKGNTATIPGVDEKSRADGSRHGGISVNWVAEGGAGTYTQPTFRAVDIKLQKIMGLVKVTNEIITDAPLLSSWIQGALPAEMAFEKDRAAFSGNGIGKPLGIMNSGALVAVAKESGQTNLTIVYENVVKMWSRMPVRHRNSAVWYITPEAESQLMLMTLVVGTGGVPVYTPPGGASVAPYGTLFGRPVIPIEQAETLGDQGDITLAAMDDYLTFEKGGTRVDKSIHVDFEKDLQSFRFIQRCNGTPYTESSLASRANASFKTSPYITLAERKA